MSTQTSDNGKRIAKDKTKYAIDLFMERKNIALITGITGQDGSYLAELLLEKVMMYTALSVVHQPTFVSALLTWKVAQTSIFTMPTSVTQ